MIVLTHLPATYLPPLKLLKKEQPVCPSVLGIATASTLVNPPALWRGGCPSLREPLKPRSKVLDPSLTLGASSQTLYFPVPPTLG